jgi:hypothetical protein
VTTYADLLYEAAEMLDESAKMVSALDHDGMAKDLPPELVILAERVREALRTRSASPALSTEDVERIRKPYDPSGSCFQDIDALANSHEQLRRERDTTESIADRLMLGYEPINREELGWTWLLSQCLGHVDRMTNDQIDWFERRNK